MTKPPAGEAPFDRLLGIEVRRANVTGSVARIVDPAPLEDEDGEVHAAAVYSAGERAARLAVAALVQPKESGARLTLRTSSVRYGEPQKGSLTAHATIIGDRPALLGRLVTDGAVLVGVEVKVLGEHGGSAAEMRFDWVVRTGP
jgi:hypothetical protein